MSNPITNDVRTTEYRNLNEASNDSSRPSALEQSAWLVHGAQASQNVDIQQNGNKQSDIKNYRMSEVIKLLSKYNLKEDFIWALLTQKGNISQEELLNKSDEEFHLILKSLELAIKDCDKNGSIDEKALYYRFIGYKIELIHRKNNVEDAKRNLDARSNMSLMDILKKHNPSIQNKNINDISVEELKNIFKNYIQKSLKSRKKPKDLEMFMDFFMSALGKCSDTEKAKIFHAFALLLKDEEMKTIIPDLYKNMLSTYENVAELTKLITKIGPEILKELGFDDKTIEILNFQGLEKLKPEQIKGILDNILNALEQIDEKELPILREALTALNNDKVDELNEEQKAVLRKYQPLIQRTVDIIAISVKRPDLKIELEEHYKKLFDKLKELELSEHVFIEVGNFYEQNNNLFEGISKDDFIKKLNEITDNCYGKAIGDTNPNNIYKENSESTSDLGISQREGSYETIAIMRENNRNTILDLYNEESKDNNFEIVKEEKTNSTQKTTTNPWIENKSFSGLSASDIYEGLRQKYIKLSDVLGEYNNLSKDGKNFVEGIIKTKSPFLQSYYLNCIKDNNSAKVEIAIKLGLDDKKLKIALDYANEKKLELAEEKREKINS